MWKQVHQSKAKEKLPRKLRVAAAVVLLTVPALACAPSTEMAFVQSARQTDADALVQFSLLAALAANDYGGVVALREVSASGNFGLGTFNRLDGEMIVLDGTIYQALADGTVRVADPDDSTPFAAVTFFEEDGVIDGFKAASLEDLDRQLDRKLPRQNSPYAVRITGEFQELTLRSVPAQTPPFRPLVEVVKHQSTWDHRNIRGTLIGLRCPNWMGTLNVSGYHWHFLSDDRTVGGHVLACAIGNGRVQFDECTSLVIHVPQTATFNQFNASEVTQQDVDQIERQRHRRGGP